MLLRKEHSDSGPSPLSPPPDGLDPNFMHSMTCLVEVWDAVHRAQKSGGTSKFTERAVSKIIQSDLAQKSHFPVPAHPYPPVKLPTQC